MRFVVMEGEGQAVEDVDARADDALDRFLPPSDEGVVARTHHVTALVLSRDGAQWLPRTLDALVDQERPADHVIGIDAGSTDGSAGLLGDGVRVLVRVEESGIADALAAGVGTGVAAGVPNGVGTGGASGSSWPQDGADSGEGPDGTLAWYWIVHDDSAPEHGCLTALLRGADRNPAAAVLIPKTVAWSDSGRLVGVGSRWAPGLPVVDPLDPTERDQGQYDVDRPVYAGDSAGMLVRADVWHRLRGMDPTMGDWAGAADLCRRVWALGSEVMFIPTAVLAHRQAGHRGVRPVPGRPHPRRPAREGQLILELSQAPAAALPWRYVRAWLSSAVRVIALLLTREPEEAAAEAAGAWRVLGSPARIHRARRSLRRPPVGDLRRPALVRARRGAALSHSLDSWAAGRRGPSSPTWWPPPARIWHPLAIAGALALAVLVREPGQLLGAGTLRGGGLLPAPGAVDLLTSYLASWHPARFGTALPMPAYLPLLSAASVPFLGSVDVLLRVVFGLAVPLAFLSCYVSLGPASSVGRHRITMAVAYSVLPAGVAAMGGGRISTLAVLLLGPPTARLVARALTRARSGSPGIRPALAAGTMLGVLVAFAPSAYLVAALGALAGWIATRLVRWPVRTGLVILGVSGLFLALWVPRVVGAPWLALSELGVNDPSLGTPPPTVWGLAPGGPTSVAWAGLPLLAVAVLAVVVARFSSRSLVLLAAAAGLLAGAAWLDPLARFVWPELGVGMLWPGVLLLLAGALLALLVARVASGPGRAGAVLSVAWMAAIGVLVVGWWVAPLDLSVSSGTGLPPVVSLDAQSPARPRSLVLERVEGQVRYAVASGPQVLLGDADAVAGSVVDPGFDDAVEGLVSGASGQVEQELGGRGIRFVAFDGPPEDPVVAELDATFGLRQLARAPEQSLWLVAGDPTRAELTDATPASPDAQSGAPLEVPVLTTPTTIDVVLHPLAQVPRRLVVAEQADAGWWGSLAGRPLDLVADARGMLWATVDTTGDLRVAHQSWWPIVASAQLALFLALVLLSMPKRRTVDPDADHEPDPASTTGGPG